MEIWIGRNGERHGPYKEEDIRQWLRSGKVSRDDLGWREGLADWQPLSVLFPDEVPSEPPPVDNPYAAPVAPASSLPQTNAAALEDYAGFWKRLAAFIIDTIILSIAFKLLGTFFGVSAAEEAMKQQMLGGMSLLEAYRGFYLNTWVYSTLTTAITWLYFASLESSAWQATVGKLALGVRVTDLAGHRISFARGLGRYAAKFLSYLILLIGFLMIGFTARKQGLHDLIASTLVLNGRASEFKDAQPKSDAGNGSLNA
ncbi:MAG: RDD family protein [Rhodanobacter sp.]|nr:MAG: RDD family protein [Rhodanobacter sp.]TAM15243.1 MAG: RDD family protein [Rhodanobacter sp.]TAM34302.1 MAG: RDD family protein [Rhodanobacter sp.]